MWKVPVAVLVVLTLAAPAPALELKNVRAIYGPFGPERPDNKFLPGDMLFLTFEIADIQANPKTGMAKYRISLNLVDSKGGLVFNRNNKAEEQTLSLGGSQLPAFADVLFAADQQPGKYTLKVTVTDLLARTAKELTYACEILPESFGFVRVFAPVAGFTGQQYVLNFVVLGMGRNAKKRPDVEIRMRVLDEAGKPMQTHPFAIPKDLDDEFLSKIETTQLVPLQYPLFLNRSGHFTIELEGTDKIASKTTKLRLPLTVVDASSIGK